MRVSDPFADPGPPGDMAQRGAKLFQGAGKVAALLRAHDWSKSPLGTPDIWPDALQTLVSVILEAKQPMYLLWGCEQIMLYNDAYAPILAGRHPASVGKSIREIWSDAWPEIGGQIERAFQGEPTYLEDFRVVLNRHDRNEDAYFSFSYTPVRAPDGGVAGMLCVCTETTTKVLADQRVAQERLRILNKFEHSPYFLFMLTGPDHIIELANSAAIRLTGNRDIVGKTFADALPDAAAQGFGLLLDGVRISGTKHSETSAKYSVRLTEDAIGEDRYVDFVFQPIFDIEGGVKSIAVSGTDVTDRVVALAELTKSEQFLKSVLASSNDCIKVLDLDANLIYMNEAGKEIMEVSDFNGLKGCPWTAFWQGDGHKSAEDAIATALVGNVGGFQGEANTMKGTPRYWDVRVTPIANDEGLPSKILVVSRDISLLHEIDKQRETMMHEMAHRMKNVLAITQAIVAQSMRHATSLQSARDAIQGRIAALSTAQDILTDSHITTADIREILMNALRPHTTSQSRIHLSGPDLRLEGQQILGLALAVHELATNAIKYGALSNDDGKVTITWEGSADAFLSLHWLESGGPLVQQPTQTGFGTKLIQTLVGSYFGAEAELEYRPGGVEFSLKAKN